MTKLNMTLVAVVAATACAGAQASLLTASYKFGLPLVLSSDFSRVTGTLPLFDSRLGQLQSSRLELFGESNISFTVRAGPRGGRLLTGNASASIDIDITTSFFGHIGVGPTLTMGYDAGTVTQILNRAQTFGPANRTDSETREDFTGLFASAGGGTFNIAGELVFNTAPPNATGFVPLFNNGSTAAFGARITYTYDDAAAVPPTVAPSGVPEPGSLPLALAALASLGGAAGAGRRCRRSSRLPRWFPDGKQQGFAHGGKQ